MFERMSFSGQLAVFAGLALGVVVAAYFVWPDLGQKRAQIATLQEEFSEKERKITEGRAIEARLPEIEREIARLEQQLRDIQQILPTDRETGDLLRWIKNLGDQSNLDLKSFSPGTLQPHEFYKEFPIEMQMVGRYHDLGIFLDRVSKYSRIINVDNLRVGSAKESGKTISVSLTATTFVYDADQAAPSQEVTQ
jgi:type IV pilus assembly protein PilO